MATSEVDLTAEPAAPAPAGGRSLLKLIAALLLLTLVAAAMGGGLGIQLAKQVEDAVKQQTSAEGKPVAEPRYSGPTHLKALAPIVTNLADPRDVWIRLECSIIFDDEAIAADEVLAGEISEDILAYLRTVSLPQIEGPSGMQHLARGSGGPRPHPLRRPRQGTGHPDAGHPMKRLAFAAIAVLLLGAAAFAQTETTAQLPDLNLNGLFRPAKGRLPAASSSLSCC